MGYRKTSSNDTLEQETTMRRTLGIGTSFFLVLLLGLLISGCNFPIQGNENQDEIEPTQPSTTQTGSISGILWHDLCDSSALSGELPEGCVESASHSFYHANGILEPGEPGIEAVEITLGNGVCPAKGVATVITGSQGGYRFSDVEAGVYCISVNNSISHSAMLEPGMWTYPKADGGTGVGWYTVNVDAGVDVQNVNFGWDDFLKPGKATPEPIITPTPETTCSDRATFMTDVTYPDWTSVETGEIFEKVWRLKNTGTCAWTTSYSLIYQGGDLKGTVEQSSLLEEVLPGDEIELSMDLIAPEIQGKAQSYWMLRNAIGETFGIGENAQKPFWAKVSVGTTPSPTAVVSWMPQLDPGELSNEGRWIDVDLGDQLLTAYEGASPVMRFLVSSGTNAHPTVTGQFRIWVKLESTRMKGPGYDLEDVPYTMYFYEGYGLHGAYWHNNFGAPMSHGCVNLSPSDAEWLFNFASVGTLVNIHS
jgi:hypothetical protein